MVLLSFHLVRVQGLPVTGVLSSSLTSITTMGNKQSREAQCKSASGGLKTEHKRETLPPSSSSFPVFTGASQRAFLTHGSSSSSPARLLPSLSPAIAAVSNDSISTLRKRVHKQSQSPQDFLVLERVETMYHFICALTSAGCINEALQVGMDCLELCQQQRLSEGNNVHVAVMGHVAVLLQQTGQLGAAVDLWRRVRTQLTLSKGAGHADTCKASQALASCLHLGDRVEEALEVWQECERAMIEGAEDTASLRVAAHARFERAQALYNHGDEQEALIEASVCLEWQIHHLGTCSEDTFFTMFLISLCYSACHKWAPAHFWAQECSNHCETLFPSNLPMMVKTKTLLSNALESLCRYNDAIEELAHLQIVIGHSSHPSAQTLLIECQLRRVGLLIAAGRHKQARHLGDAALQAEQRRDSPSEERVARLVRLVALAMDQERLHVEAHQRSLESVQQCQRIFGNLHQEHVEAVCQATLAAIHVLSSDLIKEKSPTREAVETCRKGLHVIDTALNSSKFSSECTEGQRVQMMTLDALARVMIRCCGGDEEECAAVGDIYTLLLKAKDAKDAAFQLVEERHLHTMLPFTLVSCATILHFLQLEEDMAASVDPLFSSPICCAQMAVLHIGGQQGHWYSWRLWKILKIMRSNSQVHWLSPDSIKPGERIHEGGNGEVFQAMYDSSPCVIKLLHLPVDAATMEVVHRELVPGTTGSENLVTCYGLTIFRGRWCVIMEAMDVSLRGRIDEMWSVPTSGEYREFRMDLQERLVLAYKSSLGVQDLHDVDCVHRDMKSANILLRAAPSGDVEVKIGDFGSLKVPEDIARTLSKPGITRPWCPPELFLGGGQDVSRKPSFDVYSFGVVLWELGCGYFPFAWVADADALRCEIASIDPHDEHPLLKEHPCDFMPDEYVDLIRACLQVDPSKRPKMPEVVQELERIWNLCSERNGWTAEQQPCPEE